MKLEGRRVCICVCGGGVRGCVFREHMTSKYRRTDVASRTNRRHLDITCLQGRLCQEDGWVDDL